MPEPPGAAGSALQELLAPGPRTVRGRGVGDAGHLSGGHGAQTTHSFGRGHPADGSRRPLEWSQGAGDERLPGPLMNRSPLRHRGRLHHKLYLHLLKALGGLMEAAGLWLPARGAMSLSIFTLEERVPQTKAHSAATGTPPRSSMAQAPSPPGAKARSWVSQRSPEVTLIFTLSPGWGLAGLTPQSRASAWSRT